jgi:hypothetical protein
MAGHGGSRPGSGRPFGARSIRVQGVVKEAKLHNEGLVPVPFTGDSLQFLRSTMEGKIWPTR